MFKYISNTIYKNKFLTGLIVLITMIATVTYSYYDHFYCFVALVCWGISNFISLIYVMNNENNKQDLNQCLVCKFKEDYENKNKLRG